MAQQIKTRLGQGPTLVTSSNGHGAVTSAPVKLVRVHRGDQQVRLNMSLLTAGSLSWGKIGLEPTPKANFRAA